MSLPQGSPGTSRAICSGLCPGGRALTTNPLAQADVYRMIRRRAFKTGTKTRIGNQTFRATGITEYLRNGGRRELAQQMAAHESPRTTALYDRRDDEVAVAEVERILLRHCR